MLYKGYLINEDGQNIKKEIGFRKFYCLRQVHVAENLPQATHTRNRVKTTSIRAKKCFTYHGWSLWVITISKK